MRERRKFRLAWIGTPSNNGGVGGMCQILLRELIAADVVDLDVYISSVAGDAADLGLPVTKGARFIDFPVTWNWNSWYGRNKRIAFLVSFWKRIAVHRQKIEKLAANHRAHPYDAVVQFSQAELFGLRRYAKEMPIILFPCVHAAGELEWSRKEAPLARRCEPWWWISFRDVYLAYRARVQRRDYNVARGVIGMSRCFNEVAGRDYGVPSDKMAVVYQPMDLPGSTEDSSSESLGVVRLLFVGRISVRKGIDMVIKAAQSVIRRDEKLELLVIGGGSLWSNYEPLLADLPNTSRIRWLKSLPNSEVTEVMRRADILLVPSFYEPGGIVVAEALANGMLVVASDAVGSAENLPAEVCRSFRAGDQPAFEESIRDAVRQVRTNGPESRRKAMAAARNFFHPGETAHLLVDAIKRLAKA